MKKDERIQEELTINKQHIEELEDKIHEQDCTIKQLEKKRDIAKIEIQTMEKKLEKYKEKIHMSTNVTTESQGSVSPRKIGQLNRNSLII